MKIKKFLLSGFLILSFICLFPYTANSQISVNLRPLNSGLVQTVVTVSTSATAIPTTAMSGRKSIVVKNIDASAIVYLGSSTVTADENATGGLQLDAGDSISLDIGENTVLYGIVASSTAKVVCIEAR